MSAGSFGTDPGQPGAASQAGWTPPPPQPPPPPYGQYGQPVSPLFRYDYAPPAPMPRRTNSMAIAALCCGIGQVVAGPFAGIPAIILAALSLKQIRETGEDGHAMAVIGLVLGIVGLLLTALAVLLFVGIADTVVSHMNDGGTGTG